MAQANRKVLIIDRMHESISPLLEDAGFVPDYQPNITPDEVHKHINEYAVLLLRSKMPVDAALLDKAKDLRVIGRAGAGLDQIDLEAVKARGIQLIHAPEGNRDAVAEHTVGMLLALLINLQKANAQVREGLWDREGNRGYELMGKTVGLIGFGCMGQAVAERLSGFGCQVMAYDKFRKGFGSDKVAEVSLEQLQNEADIVSFHIPLTAENRALVDETYIDRFRKDIFLINTARGEILPLDVLRNGLESGKIRAAALDVLENEKLNQLSSKQQQNFDYLVGSSQVILSPHVAGWTHESYQKINQVLVSKLSNVF